MIQTNCLFTNHVLPCDQNFDTVVRSTNDTCRVVHNFDFIEHGELNILDIPKLNVSKIGVVCQAKARNQLASMLKRVRFTSPLSKFNFLLQIF